jgi:hypothetical protein
MASSRRTGSVSYDLDGGRIEGTEMMSISIHEALDRSLSEVEEGHDSKPHITRAYGSDVPETQCYSKELVTVFSAILKQVAENIEGLQEITVRTRRDQTNAYVEFVCIGYNVENVSLPEPRRFQALITTLEEDKKSVHGRIVMDGKEDRSIKLEKENGKTATFSVQLPPPPD